MAYEISELAELIQTKYNKDLLDLTESKSVVSQFATVERLSTAQTNFPVNGTRAKAHWRGHRGLDRRVAYSTINFEHKLMTVAEVVCTIPFAKEDLEDSDLIVPQIIAEGSRALAEALDNAILYGVEFPTKWGTDSSLLASATAAGNIIDLKSDAAAGEATDLPDAIAQSAKQLLAGGFQPRGFLANGATQWDLANTRFNGQPIYLPSLSATRDELQRDNVMGIPAFWLSPDNAPADPNHVALVIDPSAVRLGIRRDITVEEFREATLGDLNLAQDGLVAFNITARYGYVLGDAAGKSPASIIRNAVATV